MATTTLSNKARALIQRPVLANVKATVDSGRVGPSD